MRKLSNHDKPDPFALQTHPNGDKRNMVTALNIDGAILANSAKAPQQAKHKNGLCETILYLSHPSGTKLKDQENDTHMQTAHR
jgi:hypothetical protein